MRDLYEVLGVSRSAETTEIRKAYKKLAREFHPDRNPSDEAAERFKEINAAYDVLGDDDKRSLYDEFGEVSTKPGFDAEKARAFQQAGGFGRGGFGGGGPGGGFRWSSNAGGPDFSGGFGGPGGAGFDADDILGSIFGGGARRGPRKGQDIQAEVTVSLLRVAHGDTVELSLRRPVADGQGGLVLRQESIKVRLPKGVEDGRTLRLRGKGGDSPSGGPAGDLLLEIHVTDEPNLRRDGDRLEMDLPLTFAEALTGASVTVPTLDGEVKVRIPPGAQSGQKLRLRGKGMELPDGRGDLILVLRPTPPEDVGEDAAELAEKLAALYKDDVRAGLPLA
ncbi:MAG: J domain-containing protein [Alphaproteobacteria bacterium]|nr:J domain-containing protein [Alphaproteobacteria bacterium]